MRKTLGHNSPVLVDLADGVLVNTRISSDKHPALRSGFAGYPSNPRWNVSKFHAWKVGRQWRDALAKGEMVVRTTDSMLVSVAEVEENADEPPSTLINQLSIYFSNKLASHQLA